MESGSGGGGVRAATVMAVIDGPRPGSRGGARMPSADGVLVAAIGLVLTGAGLPGVATRQNEEAAETGFLAVTLAGEARPRAAVTWYEDGALAGGPDAPLGRIGDCERALLRAGFRVEYAEGAAGGCLVAWRRSRLRWGQVHGAGGLAAFIAELFALEASCDTLLAEYQPALVPGLLQTAVFMREMAGEEEFLEDNGTTSANLRQLVGAKVRRQSILHEGGRPRRPGRRRS